MAFGVAVVVVVTFVFVSPPLIFLIALGVSRAFPAGFPFEPDFPGLAMTCCSFRGPRTDKYEDPRRPDPSHTI